ncbi:DHH family phosphoesterase [Bythopirellula polymerisocia]|uniref:NanoRNase/pAp phosphatase n=1 Tax=Bythopirellula polymerisocia TaxID=2528003 RepID=A0A5C6CVY4_9BACT|nr:DHH family phosphoesterase [Bythopirellula polymerisocia]TWU27844.1 NanoRNase/pAp phosphatase [Bythopirellula polymerisocia]
MTIDWLPLQKIIEQHQSFLLTSHCRADCDALGSELAMAAILEQFGKNVRIVNGDEVPRHISFIDPSGRVETLGSGVSADDLLDIDVLMVLDTSAWVQLGPMADVVKRFSGTRVVVDHHVSQDDMQATVFKDSATEATGRLVLELCNAINATVTPSIAHQLFTAIATDTGWFRFASVTEETFQALAQLVAAGANPPQIFASLYERHTLARLKLRARILENIETFSGGRLMATQVYQQDFAETGAEPADTEDVINTLLTVEGSQVAVLFVELKRITKVSLRSRTEFDVRAVAEQFGGGGHKAAAGIAYEGSLAEARAAVLKVLEAEIK